MRLTCPNCGAQYEVPDDVIPADGRDVQCSNCGTTWFQPHKDAMARDRAPEDEPDLYDSDPDDTAQDIPPPTDEMPDQMPSQARRGLSPDVADILQKEAAHEARLRAEDNSGLETQPDLGLDDTTDDAERRARQARERMERLKGPEAEPAPDPKVEEAIAVAAAAAKSSRRDRLPDIDEINSSLRSTAAAASPQDDPQGSRETIPERGGFARGFAIPLLIFAVLVLLYALAPALSEAVPALSPILTSYVLLIDQIRSALNGLLSGLLPAS